MIFVRVLLVDDDMAQKTRTKNLLAARVFVVEKAPREYAFK